MAIRKDGTDTRTKLLDAASEIFAQRGYREATVAEICHKAGSNVAAINYHFGGKDALYGAGWKQAFEESVRMFPPDGNLPPSASTEERLRAMIHSLLNRIMNDGKMGYAGQILLKELSDPVDVIDQVRQEAISSLCGYARGLIAELLGRKAGEQDILFSQWSVINQCLAIGFQKGKNKLSPMFTDLPPTADLIDALAEHVTVFSLAGIAAVKARIEANLTKKKHL